MTFFLMLRSKKNYLWNKWMQLIILGRKQVYFRRSYWNVFLIDSRGPLYMLRIKLNRLDTS